MARGCNVHRPGRSSPVLMKRSVSRFGDKSCVEMDMRVSDRIRLQDILVCSLLISCVVD